MGTGDQLASESSPDHCMLISPGFPNSELEGGRLVMLMRSRPAQRCYGAEHTSLWSL